MQADLEAYLETYNRKRPHRGRGMKGRAPYQVFKAGRTDARKAAKARKEDAKPKAALDTAPARAECQVITISIELEYDYSRPCQRSRIRLGIIKIDYPILRQASTSVEPSEALLGHRQQLAVPGHDEPDRRHPLGREEAIDPQGDELEEWRDGPEVARPLHSSRPRRATAGSSATTSSDGQSVSMTTSWLRE